MGPRSNAVGFICATLLAAACGDEALLPEVASAVVTIAHGKQDKGHPSVGRLGCSGTLIGRQTVLSAAHCFDEADEIKDLKFLVASQAYAAEKVTSHPQYAKSKSGEVDLAVVRLKKKVRRVVPSRLLTSAPRIGEKLIMVGYGLTGTGSIPGIKHVGENKIIKVYGGTFMFSNANGAGVCMGDSGGPSFVLRSGQERLAGTHVLTTLPCGGSGYGWDLRVDKKLNWIRTHAKGDVYNGEPIDSVAPVVKITSPAAGAALGPSFMLEAKITDNVGVVRAAFWLNSYRQAQLKAPPWRFKMEGLSPGKHAVAVVAYDAEENRGASSVAVTVKVAPAPGDGGEPSPDEGCALLAPAADAGPPPWALAMAILALLRIRLYRSARRCRARLSRTGSLRFH